MYITLTAIYQAHENAVPLISDDDLLYPCQIVAFLSWNCQRCVGPISPFHDRTDTGGAIKGSDIAAAVTHTRRNIRGDVHMTSTLRGIEPKEDVVREVA